MPAPKKASKRSPAKGSHKLSPGHKQALAAGRTMSATVDRYLAAVNTPKRRGRKVSKETLEARLAAALETARSRHRRREGARRARSSRVRVARRDERDRPGRHASPRGRVRGACDGSRAPCIGYAGGATPRVPRRGADESRHRPRDGSTVGFARGRFARSQSQLLADVGRTTQRLAATAGDSRRACRQVVRGTRSSGGGGPSGNTKNICCVAYATRCSQVASQISISVDA